MNVESCGLFKIEVGSNLKGFDTFVGYGILSMIDTQKNSHFILGSAGVKVKSHEHELYLIPQLTLDYPHIFVSKILLYSKVNIWCPIKSGVFDLIITPQIGYSFFLGFAYLNLGYDINTTSRLNIGNSINLNIGINLPTNLNRVIEKM